ncbi:MAG: DUF4974 domain-containing protein [Bacteroidales bacterium]|nr:DUF4974 domain-containing protein [Bacteroidales bacterium]
MLNNEKHIDLIFRFLADEISEPEKNELEDWKSSSSDNFQLFEDYLKVWNHAENKIPEEVENINIEEEWLKIKPITEKQNSAKVVEIHKKKSNTWKFVASIAAILVLSIGLFSIFHKSQETIIAGNTVLEATLPDNSIVSLNSESEIKYSKNFEENRVVELNGDAYFKVEHDSENPFIVKTENYYVEVVGTEFYVNTKGDFEVIVNKGVVKVYKPKNPADSIILRANDKVLETGQKIITKTNNLNQNFIAWKTGKIVFENADLEEIVKVLERTYNVEIEISNPDYNKIPLTVSFDNQSIESILKVVEATIEVKITKQGDKIIIY